MRNPDQSMSTFDLESGLTTTNPVAEITLAERIRLSASLVSVTIVALCVICFRSVSYSTVPLDFQQALNSSDFSGFDAYVQLQTVASSPHPVYSPENLNVYKFITNILNEYKNASTTEMHVLEFDSTLTFPQAMAYFPGVTKSTLLVSAHFDSVSTSVGATDDGASVVCMLQIARILAQSSLKPRNSILLLFNNGEEFHKLPNNTTDQGTASKYNEIQNNELYGWAQGSQKFLSSPNLKNHVENIKVFINLEGGGAGGKPMLLRTNNNRLSSLFATVAPYPHMNSFGQNFMSLIGTATDYDVFAGNGIPGMDIAFYENSRFYHTRFDSLNNIRAEDVQYMGSNALSLIKALRDAEWIDDLKVQTSSPFFDNFGGYSGVVLSPTVVNLLLSILAIGTLCIIGAGLWNLKFPSQEKSENPSTLRDLLLQVLFGVLVSIFGSLIGALCILVPFVSGIFTGKALNGQWTVAPLALLGCICAAYLASQFWRKNHLTRASLLLGTVVALVFLSLNLPFANIIAIVGVARLLAHICIDILRNHASMLFPSISPFSTEMAISFTVCVISIYPTCIIVDTIIVFARCTVGLYFQILVPALVGYTTSVLFMPVLLDMKSHQARRIVFWTTMVLVLALSLYSLVRAFV